MEKSSEQAEHPSAATNLPTIFDEEKAAASRLLRKRYWLRCCSCAGGVIFFLAILIIILLFTVFRPRDPVIWLNGSTVKLKLISGTSLPQPGSNATINGDVSMKNRNFVSFKQPSTTAPIYYRGVVIGDARSPAGNFPARRTKRMNVTVKIIMDRVLEHPDFGSDVESGHAVMSWCARVGGRAKFLFVKKHVTFKMNCTATVNITGMALSQFKCKPKFKLF